MVLWSIFIFAYLLNKTRLKLLNKTFPYLLEILEVCILPLVILFAYIYIYLRVHGEGFSYIENLFTARVNLFNEMVSFALVVWRRYFFFLSTLNLTNESDKKTWNHENPCLFSRILFYRRTVFFQNSKILL